MLLEVSINGRPDASARYLTWSPSPCQIRVLDPAGAAAPASVTLRAAAQSVAALAFYQGDAPAASSLALSIPLDGSPVEFGIAGEFGRASESDGDSSLEVVDAAGAALASVPLMVRIRKDANSLSPGERARFVSAMAQLNNQGQGPFRQFRDMHTNAAVREAHFAAGFLPWHRAYLLDLERSLQAIDPSVALPYWRFDRSAPNLFAPDFLGIVDNDAGMVRFDADNPLQFWATDGVAGIERWPLFDTSTDAASVLNEERTLALAANGGNQYADFVELEGNPHGSAHVSFDGFISDIHTAARDPLFFLLHANVDRLWAKWQWLFARFDPDQLQSYVRATPAQRIGHNLADTMWPWNEVTSQPRPPVAPGGPMESSRVVTAPGAQPRIRDMFDMQGRFAPSARLGFDYDDVPFD